MEKAAYCKEQVKADCEELLSRFQQTESVRYELFSVIWKEMNFSSIFYGRLEAYEKRSFSRVALATAFSYMLPPYTFQIRVGGLYLLYGLYHSQLLTPREKIRLALKDWEDVQKFEQDAFNAQHFDVVYVFRKLKSEKAFHFTATPLPLSFQVRKKPTRQVMCEDFMDRQRRPQELVSMEMLEEVSNVHEHYEQLKVAISATPDQPDPAITVINKDLVSHLRNTVMGYCQWQKQKDARSRGDQDDENGGEGTSEQQECSRRAELIASIKSKSYGQQAETSKARRHRPTVVKSSRQTHSFKEKEFFKRVRSLKAKTIKSLKIQGDLKEGTLKVNKPWCMTEAEAKQIHAAKQRSRFRW